MRLNRESESGVIVASTVQVLMVVLKPTRAWQMRVKPHVMQKDTEKLQRTVGVAMTS